MAGNAMYIQWRLAVAVLLDSLLWRSWIQSVLHHTSNRPPSTSSKKRIWNSRDRIETGRTWHDSHAHHHPPGNATAVLLGPPIHRTPTGIGPERRYGFQLKMVGDEQRLPCMSDIGIDHDTVSAGMVGTAIRHSTSCAGRRAAACFCFTTITVFKKARKTCVFDVLYRCSSPSAFS